MTRAAPPRLLCIPFCLNSRRQCSELTSHPDATLPPKRTRWAGVEASFGREVSQSSFRGRPGPYVLLPPGEALVALAKTAFLAGFHGHPPFCTGLAAVGDTGGLREEKLSWRRVPSPRKSKQRPDSPLHKAKRKRAVQPLSHGCSRLTGKGLPRPLVQGLSPPPERGWRRNLAG